jgi:hypothetical protein
MNIRSLKWVEQLPLIFHEKNISQLLKYSAFSFKILL